MANRMRGMLQVVSDLQQQGRVADQGGQIPSNGLAEAAGSAAADMSQLSAHIGRLADQAAQREGADEGRQAGMDPEFRPQNLGTIRAEAYDRAGLQIAETRLQTALTESLDGTYEKHKGDIKGLGGKLDGVAAGILQGAPDELKPELQLSFAKSRVGLMRQATREHEARVRAEQAGALQESLAAQMRTASQLAYGLGLDGEADRINAANVGQLSSLLSRTGVDGKPLLAPAAAAELRVGMVQAITDARLTGAFERLASIDEQRRFLDGLKGKFAGSMGLPAVYDLKGFEKIQGHLRAILHQRENEQRARNAGLSVFVKEVADNAAKGLPTKPDDLAALKSMVAGANDPRLSAGLREAEGVLAFGADFRGRSREAQETYLRTERDRLERDGVPLGAPDRVRLAFAEKFVETQAREIKQDPLAWADQIEVVRGGIPPVDPQDPVSLRQRGAIAMVVRDRFGLKETPVLFAHEAQRLSAMMARGGAEALAVAGTLASAGPYADAYMAAVGKHAPAMGVLGDLVAENPKQPPQAARDAADGMALRNLKEVPPRVKHQRSTELATEVAGPALAARPGYLAAVAAVTDLAYEARSRQPQHAGKTDFNDALWTEIFHEVLGQRKAGGHTYGGIGTTGGWGGFGGSQILVPAGVRSDKLDTLIGALETGDLDTLGRPMIARKDGPVLVGLPEIKNAHLVNVGPGRYALALGDPASADPQYLIGDPSVSPVGRSGEYILDLNRVMPELKRRRRDLFIEGAR